MDTDKHSPIAKTSSGLGQPVLRKPGAEDAARVHDLVLACPPLEPNSLYCNLLQCTHFADTSIVAEQDGEPVGWISGHRLPRNPAILFVWQVAVHADARGSGLAAQMLLRLLERPVLHDIRYLHTTVTDENAPSRALFHSVARRSDAPFAEERGFERDTHFEGRHASERLIVIGPIPARRAQVSAA